MNTDILNLPSYRVLQVEDADGDYQIKAETVSPPDRCVHCGSGSLVGFGRREQWIRDLPIHGERIGITVDTRLFRCKSCGRTFYEPLPAVDDKRLMTTRLKTWLEKKSLRHPFSQLSEKTGVGALTIRKVFDDYAQDLQNSLRFETPEVLGIDEVHLIRAVQRMGRGYSFEVLRARILFVRHGAHRMKPFRKPRLLEKPTLADDDIGYGLPSRETEMEDISQGVDLATLLELIGKGEV